MDAGLDEAIIAGLLDADVHLLNHAVFAGGEGLCNNVTFVQQEHLVATCFFNEAVVIQVVKGPAVVAKLEVCAWAVTAPIKRAAAVRM